LHLLLTLGALGCSSKSAEEPASDNGAEPIGALDTAEPDDTGWPELDLIVTGSAVEILAQAGPECGDPSQRTVATFDTHEGIGDWQNQRVPFSDLTAGRGWGLAVEDFNGDAHLDVLLPNLGVDELLFGDGDIDIYVTNRGPDRLLQNRGDGSFEDITDENADSITPIVSESYSVSPSLTDIAMLAVQ
jgi:hypothetical protein